MLLFFNLLGFFNKKRSAPQKQKRQKQLVVRAFILEQILTPSGSLIDIDGDGIPDTAADLPTDVVRNIELPDDIDADLLEQDLPDSPEVGVTVGDNVDSTLVAIAWVDSDDLDDVSVDDGTQEVAANLLIDNSEMETELENGEGELEQIEPILIDTLSNPTPTYTSGVFTVGNTGQFEVDFLCDGGGYQGQVAVFNLEGMEEYELGSDAFIQEAARRAWSNSNEGHIVIDDITQRARFPGNFVHGGDFNTGVYGEVQTFTMQAGSRFGIMLVPNGTVQQVFEGNMSGALRPLFSMATANPEDAFHVGQIADVTGEGNTFVFEDLRVDGWTDKDYNDVIFQVRGARGEAVHLDDVINPAKDWRNTDMGQMLVTYAKAYVTPDADYGGAIATGPITDIATKPVDNAGAGANDIEIVDDGGTIANDPITDIATNPVDNAGTIATGIDIVDDGGAIANEPITDIATNPVDDVGAIANDPIDDNSDTTPKLLEDGGEISNDVVKDETEIAADPVADNSDIITKPVDDGGAIASDIVEDGGAISTDPISDNSDITTEPVEDVSATATATSPITNNNADLVDDGGAIVTAPITNNFDIDTEPVEDVSATATDSNPNLESLTDRPTNQVTQDNSIGIDGLNNDAPLLVSHIDSSNQWTDTLIELVDTAKSSTQQNAVVNLSFDLTQVNPDGSVTTRYEFTPSEQAALAYAQRNNVLLVVSAGDHPGEMSAVGKASLKFDNIITVGAAERVNNSVALSKAFGLAKYSGSGVSLDVLADGSSGETVGTAVATAKVTGAVSQVWAANPELNYTQVIDIIKRTATDLGKPNRDADTGAGLLNMVAAVHLAKATQPELLPVKPLPIEPPKDEEPEVQESVIKITAEMGFLPEPIKLTDDTWFLGGPSPDKLNLLAAFSNRNAADTTNADQLWSGGGLGLNLNGSGVTVGVWDAGKVRNTHQELGSRVIVSDSASSFNDHATHVAGTIGAIGVNPEARGIANQVNIRSYDWSNSLEELEAAAKTGLTLSNHSYGSILGWSSGIDWSRIGVYGDIDSWVGDRARFSEAEGFGKYSEGSKKLDQLLQNNPNLLSIWAAGNDRGGNFGNITNNNTYVTYFSLNPGNIPNWRGEGWYRVPNSGSTTAPDKDGGNTGYDTLSSDGAIAKNTLVVGAINAITADPYNSSNVVMSSFSSWGATDDGRLKVDVVGNGVNVYSTLASSDTAYTSSSGTSMATPNVTGTAALLTQHYKNLYDGFPRSATLKGVITHTAFDAGTKGPDYTYGWGVVDGAAAATFLTSAKNQVTDRLIESTYTGSQQSYQITSNGGGSLKATLVWTDPPGTPHGNGLDETTRVLVNDLDLSITAPNGQVFYPWTLDPNNPSAPAVRTTRNNVDNIEQVLIDMPMAGTYTINVNHSGNYFTQAYSLLVSGISNPLDNPIETAINNEYQLFKHNLGNPTGPILDATPSPQGTTGKWIGYQGGTIHWTPQYGAVAVWVDLQREYNEQGGSGGWLGFPTKHQYDWNGGSRTDFEGGYIYWDGKRAKAYRFGEFPNSALETAINNEYQLYKHNLGNPTGPILDATPSPQGTTGKWIGYQGGTIHWTPQYGAVAVWVDLQREYNEQGGSGGWLGFPTKHQYDWNGGSRTDFEGGYIYWDGKQAKAYRFGEFPNSALEAA